jgi:glycosyltransferase involved in cell wall biosynthesis
MAMGCPVVITPEVGLADLVSRTGAGVVTPGEPARLAQAIAGLQDDELRRRRLGSAGRQAVLDHLSWDGVAARMEVEYRRLLGQSS